MKTRKVQVTTLITEVIERISVIEVPADQSNESVVKYIEGKITPGKEDILETDVYDISAKVTHIHNTK